MQHIHLENFQTIFCEILLNKYSLELKPEVWGAALMSCAVYLVWQPARLGRSTVEIMRALTSAHTQSCVDGASEFDHPMSNKNSD